MALERSQREGGRQMKNGEADGDRESDEMGVDRLPSANTEQGPDHTVCVLQAEQCEALRIASVVETYKARCPAWVFVLSLLGKS